MSIFAWALWVVAGLALAVALTRARRRHRQTTLCFYLLPAWVMSFLPLTVWSILMVVS